MLVVCFWLCVVCCVLIVDGCSLCVLSVCLFVCCFACSVVCVVDVCAVACGCLLFVGRWLMCVVRCLLFVVVCRRLCAIRCLVCGV